MLIKQDKIIVYDFEESCEKIETALMGLEYSRNFSCIICINMACLETYPEDMLNELDFFKKEENLFIFYEEIKVEEKYDADKQVSFLKENGFLCTTNCLCVGVQETQTIEDSMKDSMKKANFII